MAQPVLGPSVLTCPLCGFEFSQEDTACHHGCPLHTACNLTRCPLCEYEFPATPKSASWLAALFNRGGKRKSERPRAPRHGQHHNPQIVCPDHDDQLSTVRQLAAGEAAVVVHVESDDPERSNALAVFGVLPGAEITLLQRHPSYVLQVGETQLALDGEVAGAIVVRRAAARAA